MKRIAYTILPIAIAVTACGDGSETMSNESGNADMSDDVILEEPLPPLGGYGEEDMATDDTADGLEGEALPPGITVPPEPRPAPPLPAPAMTDPETPEAADPPLPADQLTSDSAEAPAG